MKFIIFLLLIIINFINSNSIKRYTETQDVPLIANRVGPFSNPSEIYSYYSLPYCEPQEIQHQSHEFGELLAGDRKVRSLYDINYRVNVPWRRLCNAKLSIKDIKKFQVAVDEEYYFEMFLDGLPIWGYVGDSDKETDLLLSGFAGDDRHKYIYTHLHFSISYNDGYVIEVNVTANPTYKFDISEFKEFNNEEEVDFSYSVEWIPTDITYENRMDKYEKMHFLPASYQIHWLSIINSFVLVIFLTVFLAFILIRILKNDFTRYMQQDQDELGITEEETGWKLIHGDVFRFPKHKMIFAALLGSGTQLLCMTIGVLTLSIISSYSPTKRGAIQTASIVLYALTAGIGGYVSGKYYKQFGGTNWVWNTILCAVLFPGPLFIMFAILNTIAFSHGSISALPIGTIIVILLLYVLVTFPLTVVGSIYGRKTSNDDFDAPCRTTKIPRQIPTDIPWYRKSLAQYFMAGFLPFSSIYIEIHYIFASVWGHRVYTLFGVLFIAFILLIIVTAFITIALTYFQLVIEDHKWWWRSFISGGASGFGIFLYSFFYYFKRSDFNGFMQTSFFFGYMIIISYGTFIMLGTVGFIASLIFVKRIYKTIKVN